MTVVEAQAVYRKLDDRRKRLGMSRAALAKRACVSQPTATRILTGKEDSPRLANVHAIARAMGVSVMMGTTLDVHEEITVKEFQQQAARMKAQRLVGVVQGTMALEAQAVGSSVLSEMLVQTMRKLLLGTQRRLWED